MRRPTIALCVALLVFGMATFAQAQQATTRAPDCLIPFSFTAAGSAGGPGTSPPPYFDNRGRACNTWTLNYQSTGFSAVSIQIDEAPLSTTVDAAGTFIVWPSGQVYSGTLPLTVTTVSQISMFGYHPFVRVTLNSKTGTGRIYGTAMGWVPGPGDATAGTASTIGVTQSTSPWIVAGGGTAGTAASGVVTVQGIASGTALPISGTVTVTDGAGALNVIVDSGTTAVTQATASSLNAAVVGATAVAATYAGNPVNIACKGLSAEQTAVTTGQEQAIPCDLVGKLIVIPYANPENFVNGTVVTITDTTSTATMASAGGSLRNYVTHCTLTNSHATVATLVKILDGTTVIDEVYLAALGGGASFTYPVPLKGTAATAINIQPVTTGANVLGMCNGYKGL